MLQPPHNRPDVLMTDLFDLTTPNNSSTFVDRILTNDLLFDIVFDACSSASIIRVSHTCRTAYGSVQSYMIRAFDVNVLLSRYFPDPLEFRTLQRRTGALISGSTALQFFLRERYRESDLDVYVRKDAFEEVARWVLAQGYCFTPSQHQDADFETAVLNKDPLLADAQLYDVLNGMCNVLTFVKPSESDTEMELKVQIIGAMYTSMEVIMGFHSTLVFNVIAWDYAYCFYPLATLEHRQATFLQHMPNDRTDPIIQKYTARGFTIITDISDPTTRTRFCGHVTRGVGDKHTWVVCLPTDGIATLEHERALPRDPCICTAWRLCGSQKPIIRTGRFKRTRTKLYYMDYDDSLGELYGALDRLVQQDKKMFLDEELVERYGTWQLERGERKIPPPELSHRGDGFTVAPTAELLV